MPEKYMHDNTPDPRQQLRRGLMEHEEWGKKERAKLDAEYKHANPSLNEAVWRHLNSPLFPPEIKALGKLLDGPPQTNREWRDAYRQGDAI